MISPRNSRAIALGVVCTATWLEIVGRKQRPSLRVARVSNPGTPPSGPSGETEKGVKATAKAKTAKTRAAAKARNVRARAKARAKEKERKGRKDSMKWRSRAVNRKAATAKSGMQTRAHGMRTTVAQEGRVA